jgi:hypothetical protein
MRTTLLAAHPAAAFAGYELRVASVEPIDDGRRIALVESGGPTP